MPTIEKSLIHTLLKTHSPRKAQISFGVLHAFHSITWTIFPGGGWRPRSSQINPKALSLSLQNSHFIPEIVAPDHSISHTTQSRLFMCSRTYLRTPGAASSLLYFVRGQSTPIFSTKALDMSRQRARILFTILTKVATLLVPTHCNTVKHISPCSVSITIMSLLTTARGTCSYPAKKSISELITCPSNL